MYNKEQLENKVVTELKEIAKSLNIRKHEILKKEELIYSILDHQAANPTPDILEKEKIVIKNNINNNNKRQRKPIPKPVFKSGVIIPDNVQPLKVENSTEPIKFVQKEEPKTEIILPGFEKKVVVEPFKKENFNKKKKFDKNRNFNKNAEGDIKINHEKRIFINTDEDPLLAIEEENGRESIVTNENKENIEISEVLIENNENNIETEVKEDSELKQDKTEEDNLPKHKQKEIYFNKTKKVDKPAQESIIELDAMVSSEGVLEIMPDSYGF